MGPIHPVMFDPRRKLVQLAYPVFNCDDCIGMREHGCQCAAYGAVAPCTPPNRWHRTLRFLLRYGCTIWEVLKTFVILAFGYLVLYIAGIF
jgi:hypothetical protein